MPGQKTFVGRGRRGVRREGQEGVERGKAQKAKRKRRWGQRKGRDQRSEIACASSPSESEPVQLFCTGKQEQNKCILGRGGERERDCFNIQG